MQLVSLVPTDPTALSKLGEVYDGVQDKSQAFQYHYEVTRNKFLPVDVLAFRAQIYIVRLNMFLNSENCNRIYRKKCSLSIRWFIYTF